MRLPFLAAVACLSIAAQTPDLAADLVAKAYNSLRSQDLVGAIAYFEDARRVDPARALIHKELGYLNLRAGHDEEARGAFERALELDPDDGAIVLQLAYAHQAAGAYDQARALLERAAANADPDRAAAARAALEANQAPLDPVHDALGRAYAALREGEYDAAVAAFAEALRARPDRADIHKESGYALLKTGDLEAAREAFIEAARLDPSDERAALEAAFLQYETGRPIEALAAFRDLRAAADPETRRTADEAAARVEAELSALIERWEGEVAQDRANRAAQLELAELYEKNGDPTKASIHYVAAWDLPGPNRDEILIRLGRARQAAGDPEGAVGAWLAAARSEETRIAEQARERLPERFPYANEFRAALALDPENVALRKELAYLLLEVGETEQGREEFEKILSLAPGDVQSAAQLAFLYLERGNSEAAVHLLEAARARAAPGSGNRADALPARLRAERARPARELAEKSLRKSYLADAREQFHEAYRINPDDLSAAYKLGVVNNLMQEDREAVRWFRIASESGDPAVAEPSLRAYRALAPQYRRATTTVWMFPFVSTRFNTVFGYAQAKTEFNVDKLPFKPYVSLRVNGDVRRRSGGQSPQLLSESSLIAAFGVRKSLGRGLTFWAEAGESFSYLSDRPAGVPGAAPDYRGGFNWFRAGGPTLGSRETGKFWEANVDAVYISRFDDDILAYTQVKSGYRPRDFGPLQTQWYLNWNATVDTKREYWANVVEVGPGMRFRLPKLNQRMHFSVDFLRGVHLSNRGNIRGPNYFDLRVGLWYSFAR